MVSGKTKGFRERQPPPFLEAYDASFGWARAAPQHVREHSSPGQFKAPLLCLYFPGLVNCVKLWAAETLASLVAFERKRRGVMGSYPFQSTFGVSDWKWR